jgi:hypothetical protein
LALLVDVTLARLTIGRFRSAVGRILRNKRKTIALDARGSSASSAVGAAQQYVRERLRRTPRRYVLRTPRIDKIEPIRELCVQP